MRNFEIVKQDFLRSYSTKSLRPKTNTNFSRKKSIKTSRDSSFENSLICKSEKSLQEYSSSGFIKAKPAKNSLKISNPSCFAEKIQRSNPAYSINSSLTSLVSSFTIKSIELMKKDFLFNETIYTHFLALMSEIDEVFEKNPILHFSLSNARDVFRLYTSRPGQVLLTIKCLPKTVSRIRISKKVLTQSYNALKGLSKQSTKGIALRVYNLCLGIIKCQKDLNQENFLHDEGFKMIVRTQENLMTDDKSSDISIMDINTIHNQSECFSTEPVQTCDSEESYDFSLKSCKKEENKSIRTKMIEQLYLKLNMTCLSKENHDSFRLATFGNQGEGSRENSIKRTEEGPEKNVEETSPEIPRYMRSLQKDTKERIVKSCNPKDNSLYTRMEYYEMRRKKKIEEDRKKKIMMQENRRRKQEKIEMEEYLLAKKTIERFEKKYLFAENRKNAEIGKTSRYKSSNIIRK